MEQSNRKIRLLVCFVHAHIGGAMTSLINFLNALNTDVYDVDVLFYEKEENERYGIKKEINILPQAKQHKSLSLSNIVKKMLSPSYIMATVADKYYKLRGNKRLGVQIMSRQGARYTPPLHKTYDIAVAYEFNWCMHFVMNQVKADKKVLWHHVEYEKSGMDFRVDKPAMDKADALVFVSEDCLKSFKDKHPEYKEKLHFIPNLLTSAYVRHKGEENISDIPFSYENTQFVFVTVARIKFEHKGLDRAVRAFSRLKKDGLMEGIRWMIIGKGSDEEALRAMIETEELQDHIFVMGVRENPLPYLKQADAFLLPSRHEGKPMVITESFIMGLVPVVTAYTSAREQIRDGADGMVLENNEEALYLGLKRILENPEIIEPLRQTVQKTEYGNESEIAAFDNLVKQLHGE